MNININSDEPVKRNLADECIEEYIKKKNKARRKKMYMGENDEFNTTSLIFIALFTVFLFWWNL
jgi:hypothetical protein